MRIVRSSSLSTGIEFLAPHTWRHLHTFCRPASQILGRGMEDDVSNRRERSFAEIWSRAQRDRSLYLQSWLNSANRQFERWLTCWLANARHKQRARRHNALEHDPEKWIPVFGKNHAPPKGQSGMTT
jgi:hypothetical protein